MPKEEVFGFEIIRKKVKNITIQMNIKGNIFITAPMGLDIYHIEKFVESKTKLIDKWRKTALMRKKMLENLDLYEDNTYILFYGRKYILRVNNGDKNIEFSENTITITSPNEKPEAIKSIVYNELYFPKARKLFPKRLVYYLDMMDEVNDIKLTIGNMKGKWGLCTPTKREIKLSIELMKKSMEEIDSVIVHEIAHLKHPNHSKNFYLHIDKFFKGYKEINKKLNMKI